jgi:hypothetical protein
MSFKWKVPFHTLYKLQGIGIKDEVWKVIALREQMVENSVISSGTTVVPFLVSPSVAFTIASGLPESLLQWEASWLDGACCF